MTDITRYATDEDFFIDLKGIDGNRIEWVQTDFRDGEKSEYNPKSFKKEFAEFDPQRIGIMARLEKDEKIKRWLFISFITGVLSVLSWWALWH